MAALLGPGSGIGKGRTGGNRARRRGARCTRHVGQVAGAGPRWAGRAQRPGQVLQGTALGVDADERFDQAADQHDVGTDQVADEQLEIVGAVTNKFTIDQWSEGSETVSYG